MAHAQDSADISTDLELLNTLSNVYDAVGRRSADTGAATGSSGNRRESHLDRSSKRLCAHVTRSGQPERVRQPHQQHVPEAQQQQHLQQVDAEPRDSALDTQGTQQEHHCPGQQQQQQQQQAQGQQQQQQQQVLQQTGHQLAPAGHQCAQHAGLPSASHADLADLLQPLQDDANGHSAGTQHKQQQQTSDSAWRAQRPNIMLAMLAKPGVETPICGCCGAARAVVVCRDCRGLVPLPLCYECDVRQHPYAHLHRREAARVSSRCELAPCTFIRDEHGTLEERELYIPVPPFSGRSCGKCGCTSFSKEPSKTRPLKYIMHGSMQIYAAGYPCTGCGEVCWQGPSEFVSVDCWPATVAQVSTIVDTRLLERWRALTNKVPKASMSGFLAAVAAEGKMYGVQSRDIDQSAFQRCYTEYRLAEAAVNEQIAGVHMLECAACGPTPLAMHVDGNHKLFCWSHNQDHSRPPITTGILFHPDSEVHEHVQAINAVSQGKQQVDATCGGFWRAAAQGAASSSSSSSAAPDGGGGAGASTGSGSSSGHTTGRKLCTGRVYAVCRHAIPYKAVNMIASGELYGYANYLCCKDLYPRGVKLIFLDTCCKFEPWREKTAQQLEKGSGSHPGRCAALQLMREPPSGSHVLAEAHGRGHSIWCQVLHRTVYMQGACYCVGEQAEQVFSHESARAQSIKTMAHGQAVDTLTFSAMDWSGDKRQQQAKALVKRHKEVGSALAEVQQRLQQECLRRTQLEPDALERDLRVMLLELQQLATAELQRTTSSRKDKVEEFYVTELALQRARHLQSFVGTTHEQRQAAVQQVQMCADTFGDLVEAHESAQAVVKQIPDLTARLERLKADLQCRSELQQDGQLSQAALEGVLERRLQHLEHVIEGHFAEVVRKFDDVQRLAEGAKAKTAASQRARAEARKLQGLVDTYNTVVVLSPGPRQAADGAAIQAAAVRGSATDAEPPFPWLDQAISRPGSRLYPFITRIGVRHALFITELLSKRNRLREELGQLAAEMQGFRNYMADRLSITSTRAGQVQRQLAASDAAAVSGSSVAGMVCAWTAGSTTSSTAATISSGYQLGSHIPTDLVVPVLLGLQRRLWAAADNYQQLHSDAAERFADMTFGAAPPLAPPSVDTLDGGASMASRAPAEALAPSAGAPPATGFGRGGSSGGSTAGAATHHPEPPPHAARSGPAPVPPATGHQAAADQAAAVGQPAAARPPAPRMRAPRGRTGRHPRATAAGRYPHDGDAASMRAAFQHLQQPPATDGGQ